LPVGDGAAEFPLLPLAAGCEVLHEGRTEQLLRGCGVREPLGGLTQGARQLALCGELAAIGIAADRLVTLDAMFDAPQARTECRGETQIGVAVTGRDPALQPPAPRAAPDHAHRAGAVLPPH